GPRHRGAGRGRAARGGLSPGEGSPGVRATIRHGILHGAPGGHMTDIPLREGAEQLSPQHASLAFGVPRSDPGTIYALSVTGGVRFTAREERTVVFGRNRPDVHVCVGEDDLRISRNQGTVTYRSGRWWLANTGHRALQLPRSMTLFPEDDPYP